MYSVIIMAAMSTAPVEPAGLFHRRAAGCTGQVAAVYAVPVRGCSGGFAAAPQAGCTGVAKVVYAPVAVAPAVTYAAPVVKAPPRTPVRTTAKIIGYKVICRNGQCVRVPVYE